MKTANYYFHLQYPISIDYVERMRETLHTVRLHHEFISDKLTLVWSESQYNRTYELLDTQTRIIDKLKAIDNDFELWFAKVYL